MVKPTKIVVAGIGGVGGYFGGLLAKKYEGDEGVQIHFLARGAHLKQIQDQGLKVVAGAESFTAKPYLATDNAAAIGLADYIFICTKNYDLAAVLDQLKPCIGQDTLLIPLLNGVEAVETIQKHLPHHLPVFGCAYIVAALQAPGIVENMGNRQEIHFGLDNAHDERLAQLEKICQSAQLTASYSQQILPVVWEKFIFLSCIATATSYFNKSVGQLLEQDQQTLTTLLNEVTEIALKKGIAIDSKIKAKAMAHYRLLPYEATSSMHRDFSQQKPKTELHSLTGYVVKTAQSLGLSTPTFNEAYQELLKR